MGITKRIIAILLASFMFGQLAFASKTFSITGSIIKITPDVVTISGGMGPLDFDRKALDPQSSDHLKVGDKVTVSYMMTVKKISHEQPGQVAPKIPLDDRAFYYG